MEKILDAALFVWNKTPIPFLLISMMAGLLVNVIKKLIEHLHSHH